MAQPPGTRSATAETVAVFEPNVTGRGAYPVFRRLANRDLDMPNGRQYRRPKDVAQRCALAGLPS